MRAWLDANTAGDASLSLTRVEAKAVFDELSRLAQSADRLRKQNKKLRNKVARLKGDDAVEDDSAEDSLDDV